MSKQYALEQIRLVHDHVGQATYWMECSELFGEVCSSPDVLQLMQKFSDANQNLYKTMLLIEDLYDLLHVLIEPMSEEELASE